MEQADCSSDGALLNLATLGETVGDAQILLRSLQQAIQPSILATDADLLVKCEALLNLCEKIESMVGTGEKAATAKLPLMMVLGQPNSGKSTLINEMLGKRTLRQFQLPKLLPRITKIRYSNANTKSNKAKCTDNATCASGGETGPLVTEASPLVVELGLNVELLKQSGLEIVDSSGSYESPPIDCLMVGASPAVIVYVIDACSGVTREVEEDISQLRFRYPSSQLVFVLNKMDASAEVSEAAEVSRSEAHSAMLDRTISGLERIGVKLVSRPSELSDSSSQLFCISCRRLSAIRRGLRSNDNIEMEEETKMWQESLQSLRRNIACGINRRLQEMVTEAAKQLDITAKLLSQIDVHAEDIRERKHFQWENISNLQMRTYKDIEKLVPAKLVEKLTAQLEERKKEIAECVRATPEEPQKTEAEAILDIERQVFERQLEVCQKVADMELENRMRQMDDILATLADYCDPFGPASLPKFDRELSIKEGVEFSKLERLPGKKNKPKLLSRSFGLSKPAWRVDTAKQFMGSVDLTAALMQTAEKLAMLMRNAQCQTLTAVSKTDKYVNEFLEQLSARRKCLANLRLESLKLWLRLRSCIIDIDICSFQSNKKICIGVGAQGSIVYKFAEPDGPDRSEGAAPTKAMIAKKIIVDDEQFTEMAAGLKYCCKPTNDSVLPIRAIVIKKLSSEPTVWKLHLWSDLMKHQSLQQQISHLHEQKSVSELLKIGLRIAEAVARLHKDRQRHGNLRLSNVFVSEDGNTVTLSDVGQARFDRLARVNEAQKAEEPSVFPPELRGEGSNLQLNQTASVDAYALGILLNALLCKKQLTFSEEQNALLSQLIAGCTRQVPGDRATVIDIVGQLGKISART